MFVEDVPALQESGERPLTTTNVQTLVSALRYLRKTHLPFFL